ncbi:MAG: 2-C-methyl-D-erythritol 4-phosphate cytidylyltransferase [Oscillospiraceae bacterium]|nr:2-C-methyl-D-erythritol 4-phosphate cytidylyltransferase [Oscillospiraceae bacterium]
MNKPNSVSVIIAAGGSGERMKGINKLMSMIGGMPVIAHSMRVFNELPEVMEIIVTAREEELAEIEKIAHDYGISKFACCVPGGKTRQQSVVNGLRQASRETELIAVHDGARPLVKGEYIKQCIKDAGIFGGAVLGVPVKDTIKEVRDGLITDTPDRRRLYIAQTPQIFKKKIYFDGVNFAEEHELDFTDDCQMAEAVGVRVAMTPSDYLNIKITTPEDLQIAELLLTQAKPQNG